MAIDYGPVHALTVELHGGFLALAFFAIVSTFICSLVLRFSKAPEGRAAKWFSRAGAYLDAAGLVSAMAGVLFLVLSAATGMLVDPVSDLLGDPLVQNKIVLSLAALAIWSGLVFVRCALGRKLWTFPWVAGLYALFAVIGYVLVLTVITLGFTVVDGSSVLDPLWSFFGIDLTKSIVMSTGGALAVLVGSIIVILACLWAAWRYRLGTKVVRSDEAKSRWKVPRK